LVIWLNFFLFLQAKPCFCRLFAWSPLDFSAIPVSISAVSLGGLTTYILLDFKVATWTVSSLAHCSNPFQVNMFISRFIIQILQNIQNVHNMKRRQKKRDIKFSSFQICVGTNLSAPSCFFPSVFWEKFLIAKF
jgi:hypothetical protein